MDGVWFAAMVAVLVVAGVVVQLGWQLPERDDVKRVLQRGRLRDDQKPTPPPRSAAVAEPR